MKTISQFVYTIFFLFITCLLPAQNVTINRAMNIAKNHLSIVGGDNLKSARINGVGPQLFSVLSSDSKADTLLFILNDTVNNSFVIVSADERVWPIIGYSLESEYNENNQPPAFTEWIENRKKEIEYIKRNNIQPNSSVSQQWDNLSSSNSFSAEGTSAVEPLLKTQWNQGCYYNTMCPADTSGSCGHVWTGCVATAMAQIMKYWNFPNSGIGSHTYIHSTYGQLSADFGSTIYQWQLMPERVEKENESVATLMYHCGVSVNMNYSPDGSGAGAPRDAFINYFKYSTDAQFISKNSYSETDWINLIKSELDLQRPVWYDGFGNNSGHAFVCDGYQNQDYFHFNWGWGGYSDGYFYLGSLNPGGSDFSLDQGAVIKIFPGSLPDGLNGFYLSNNSASFGSNGGVDSILVVSGATWTAVSDQAWLTLSQVTGNKGTTKLILKANENLTESDRSANVIISMNGFGSKSIRISQPAKINVTAGELHNFLLDKLSTITNLTLTGTIDARDFKTMRDEMPMLAKIDLSGVTIVAYSGTEGTTTYSNNYPANAIPDNSFFNSSTGQGKTSLISFIFPVSVTSIGSRAFRYCSALTSVTIPSSVISIQNTSFVGSGGEKIVASSNLNYSSIEGVLYNKALTTLLHCPVSKTGTFIIPSTVTTIGLNSLWDCSKLTSVIIPSSVMSIETQSFWGCSRLTAIEIPLSVTYIGGYTFTGCYGLSSFVLPSSVTSIGDYTFQNCSGLISVIIPSSITSIGNKAFTGCTKLDSVYANSIIPVDLQTSTSVFNNVNKTTCKLFVPFGSKEAYQLANQWQDFTNIVEMDGLEVSTNSLILSPARNSSATADVISNTHWTASSDQAWLTISSTSGTGNKTLVFTAEANPVTISRTAKITVSAANLPLKTIIITQEPKAIVNNHFIPVWTGNGIDQMNINIIEAKHNGLDLEPGDEIGIFDGNLCVGIGNLTKTIDPQNLLTIKVSRNDGSGNGYTSGHDVLYKIWDYSAGKEYQVSEVQCFSNQLNPENCQPFEIRATAYVKLSGVSIICQKIGFRTGWNIFSVAASPNPAEIEVLFQPVITNKSLVKIQDESGNSLEDWGLFGGWQDNIGDISPTEGYKIKLSKTDSVEICGVPVDYPVAIPLNAGWNIMGYPQTKSIGGIDVLQQLITRGTLLKAQDELGNSIEDWGLFGGWQNNIGDFTAAEGYKIKLRTTDTLWIYDNYPKSTTILPQLTATMHFAPQFEGNGVDHMNINVVGLPVNMLKPGDELAVFDGTTCVGAVTIMLHHLKNNAVSVAASATDNQGMAGFAEGNQFTLKLWNSGNNHEFILEPEIVKGTSTFTKHETTVVSLEKYATTGLEGIPGSANTEINCYPNPFSDEVTIEINLETDAHVQVQVLNQLGQLVKTITTKKHFTSGVHRLIWNGRNAGNGEVAPGIYHLRIEVGEKKIHKKILYSM